MIEREKVIKALECCLKESDHLDSDPCNGCPYAGKECIDRMKADALKLLKEQKPAEPIKLENWWKCPSCSGNIVYNMKYCPGCGRKVKWE